MKPLTKEQRVAKLARYCESAVKYAKDHGLQVLIFHEADNHQLSLSQNCTTEMWVNVAAHCGIHHPDEVRRARMIMVELMGQEKVKSQDEEPPKLDIVSH